MSWGPAPHINWAALLSPSPWRPGSNGLHVASAEILKFQEKPDVQIFMCNLVVCFFFLIHN